MGKGKSGRGKGGSGYSHSAKKGLKGGSDAEMKREMRTHESEERKMAMVRRMKISQLKGHYEKQRQRMSSYIPDEIRERMKQKIDPAYDLKGAARVAREFYKPPGDTSVAGDDEPRNLLQEFAGKIWEAPDGEGKVLLEKMILYAAGLHNILEQTSHAIKVFYEILEHDPEDHYNAKHRILRCYMDIGEAGKARALIEKYEDDRSCCFMYNKALIEYISFHTLQEDGSSQEICDKALEQAYHANAYALFALAYNSVFKDTVEYANLIRDAPEGSVEDAISFFESDIELWEDVDGAIRWVQEYVSTKDLPPPLVEVPPSTQSDDNEGAEEEDGREGIDQEEADEEEGEGKEEIVSEDGAPVSALGELGENPLFNEAIASLSENERHAMYLGMVKSAFEMAEII